MRKTPGPTRTLKFKVRIDVELGRHHVEVAGQPNDAPAVPEHPVSQTGDLWLLGRSAKFRTRRSIQFLDPVLDVVQVDQQYLLGSDFTIARAFPNRVAHQVQTQDGRSASRNAPSCTETWRAERRSEWARARSVPNAWWRVRSFKS